MGDMLRVLFATAEFAPLARVGGLAEATSGLVAELRADRRRYGVDVNVVLPDYGNFELADQTVTEVVVPEWAGGSAVVRRGQHDVIGDISLVSTRGTERPHPYGDVDGNGWPDNDRRFFGFSAAVAALCERDQPDVLHLNDWHTAATLGFLAERPPTVLTIHTLGYQGITSGEWLGELPHYREAYRWYDVTNPLVGAIRLADKIIAVSPNYAKEIVTEQHGAGHHEELAARGAALVGIRNGIDVAQWNPHTDPHIAVNYRVGDAARKKFFNQQALLQRVGLPTPVETDAVEVPVFGVVTRLVDQKGVDLLLETVGFLEHLDARLVILGSGDAHLAAAAEAAATQHPDRVAFHNGYDAELAHQIFAGTDLFLMPSRFEPCGLAQMQAMTYGTLPIVTAVGGLVDTVIDVNDNPATGTGFIAREPNTAHLVDAMHRAVNTWRSRSARATGRRNGMTTDWSWANPAAEHVALWSGLARPTSNH